MRLPDSPKPASRVALTGCRQGRLDLTGVVGIVIDYHDAVHLTAHIETPACATEFSQRVCCGCQGKLEQVSHTDNRQCIEDIMAARQL